MDMQIVEQLEKTHLLVWNEKDRAKRDSQMSTIYAERIRMYDKEFILNGRKEVSDFIDKLFVGDPNFQFDAAKPMEPVQDGIRFAWIIKTGGQVLTGMDFFVLEEGQVAHLYVFMDPVGKP